MCFAKRFFSVCVISATKALKRFDFIRIDVEHPQARNCPETFFARDKSQATIDVAAFSAFRKCKGLIKTSCSDRFIKKIVSNKKCVGAPAVGPNKAVAPAGGQLAQGLETGTK